MTVADTVMLFPDMFADIPCEVQGMNVLAEFMGLLEPSDKFSERYSAGAFRTAVSVKEGHIPVRVFNCLIKPLKIYRYSSIGDISAHWSARRNHSKKQVWVWATRWYPLGLPRKMVRLSWKLNIVGSFLSRALTVDVSVGRDVPY